MSTHLGLGNSKAIRKSILLYSLKSSYVIWENLPVITSTTFSPNWPAITCCIKVSVAREAGGWTWSIWVELPVVLILDKECYFVWWLIVYLLWVSMLIYALSAGHRQPNLTSAIMYLQLTCSHTPQVIVIQVKHLRAKVLDGCWDGWSGGALVVVSGYALGLGWCIAC